MALYFCSLIWWTFYTFRTIVWCKIIPKTIAFDKARNPIDLLNRWTSNDCAFTAWKFVTHLNTLFSHWSIQSSKVPCSATVYLMVKLWWRRSALRLGQFKMEDFLQMTHTTWKFHAIKSLQHGSIRGLHDQHWADFNSKKLLSKCNYCLTDFFFSA